MGNLKAMFPNLVAQDEKYEHRYLVRNVSSDRVNFELEVEVSLR